MNANADDHRPERIVIISTNHHLLKVIVIQNTVIYALTGSAFAVDGTVKISSTGYAWMKAQVSADLKVNRSAIAGVGAFAGTGTFADFTAFIMLTSYASYTKPLFAIIKMPENIEKSSFLLA